MSVAGKLTRRRSEELGNTTSDSCRMGFGNVCTFTEARESALAPAAGMTTQSPVSTACCAQNRHEGTFVGIFRSSRALSRSRSSTANFSANDRAAAFRRASSLSRLMSAHVCSFIRR
jgi:hypothetical protein